MSDPCACIIDLDYDESPASVHDVRIVKARKIHKCCECRDTINVGEKYEYVFGKWDGEIGVFKTCLSCVSVRNNMFCSGFVYEELWSAMQEYILETTDEKYDQDWTWLCESYFKRGD